MVIDPRMLKRAVPPKMISEPTPCRFCGYDLIGLMNNAKCPECGKPIQPKSLSRYGEEQITEAPIQYLRVLALGMNLVFFGWLALAAGVLWLGAGPSEGGALTYTGGAVVWWIGIMLVARPRPPSEQAATNRMREWLTLRLASRFTQAFWILSGGMVGAWVAATARGTTQFDWLNAAAMVAAAVGSVGLIPVCIFLSNLGYWASDTSTAMRLRMLTFLVAFVPASLISVSAGVMPLANWLLMSKAAVMVAFLLIGVVILMLPALTLTWCLWSMRHNAAWAVANHQAVKQRDERFRERSAAEAQRGVLADTGVDPSSLPGFRLAPSSDVDPPPTRSLAPGNVAKGMAKKKSPAPDPYDIAGD